MIESPFLDERAVLFDTGTWGGDVDDPYKTDPYNTVQWWEDRIDDFAAKNYNTIWFAHYATNSNAAGIVPGGGGSWYPYQYNEMPTAWQTWWSDGSAAAYLAAAGFTKIYAFISKNHILNVNFRDVEKDDDPQNGVLDWKTVAYTADSANPTHMAAQAEIFEGQWTDHLPIEAILLDNRSGPEPVALAGAAEFDNLQAEFPDLQLGTEGFMITRDAPEDDYYLKPDGLHIWQFATRSHVEGVDINSEPYLWDDLRDNTGRWFIVNSTVGQVDRQDVDWFHKRLGQGMYPIAWWRFDAQVDIVDAFVLWPQCYTRLGLTATPAGDLYDFSYKIPDVPDTTYTQFAKDKFPYWPLSKPLERLEIMPAQSVTGEKGWTLVANFQDRVTRGVCTLDWCLHCRDRLLTARGRTVPDDTDFVWWIRDGA